MPKTAQDVFKDSLDKAYTGIKLNQGTMTDYAQYRQGVKEDELEDSTPMIRRSIKKLLQAKKTENKEQEDKKKYLDIQDMIPELKRQLNKGTMFDKDHKKPKKKETKEATGSGSSGAFSAPVFGGNDEFWERSRKETPKLKESDVEKVEATEATGSGSVGGYSQPAMWAKSTTKKDWGPSRKTQIPGGGFVKIKKKCSKFPYCNKGDINAIKISKNESVKEAIKNVAKNTGISETVIKTILEHEYEKINKRHN